MRIRLEHADDYKAIHDVNRAAFDTSAEADLVDALRAIGFSAVVVLGHERFYPRFGCEPASRFGLRSTYGVSDDVFMALELVDGALQGASGVIQYDPAFADTR